MGEVANANLMACEKSNICLELSTEARKSTF